MTEWNAGPKPVMMVKALYNNTKCTAIDESGSSDWFEVKAGVF